jgi:hypothetical protein
MSVHVGTQAPSTQLRVAPHAMSHRPQLSRSDVTSTQPPPHSTVGLAQPGASAGVPESTAVQAPSMHRAPPVQSAADVQVRGGEPDSAEHAAAQEKRQPRRKTGRIGRILSNLPP